MKKARGRKGRVGSSFDEFLKEDGTYVCAGCGVLPDGVVFGSFTPRRIRRRRVQTQPSLTLERKLYACWRRRHRFSAPARQLLDIATTNEQTNS